MLHWTLALVTLVLMVIVVVVAVDLRRKERVEAIVWTPEERATLAGLWIGALGPLPPDPSNAVADDPRAAALGQALFFDTRLSGNGAVSCATCHQPDEGLQDGLPRALGIGQTDRRAMPLADMARSPWYFWDGRADSQWSQALGPLEHPLEHGGTRGAYAQVIAREYRAEYEALFGPLPDLADADRFPAHAGPVADPTARADWEAMRPEDQAAVTRIFTNIGKAIAAYERLLVRGPSRFDAWVSALLAGDEDAAGDLLSEDELAGLRIFIGKGNCTNCHNGPLLTNNVFHNTGVPPGPDLQPDPGRTEGVEQLLASEFTCLGPYSDAAPEECGELRFLAVDEELQTGAFKTPSLRDVAERAPYMHAGQFATLREVLEHYNSAPEAALGHSELQPLQLTDAELDQLEAFLRMLSGGLATPPELLVPP